MMTLVCYDVCTEDRGGKTRLRKVAKEAGTMGSVSRIQFLRLTWTMALSLKSRINS